MFHLDQNQDIKKAMLDAWLSLFNRFTACEGPFKQTQKLMRLLGLDLTYYSQISKVITFTFPAIASLNEVLEYQNHRSRTHRNISNIQRCRRQR